MPADRSASDGAPGVPDFRLDGRLALVTAASRGIGAAIAVALAHYGADVGINYLGDDAEAEAVADRAREAGGQVWLCEDDLCRPGAPAALLDWLKTEAGRPADILVSCGAIQIERHWSEVTEEQADAHWRLNLRASYALIQAALPAMIDNGWGRVITIGSVQEIAPEPEMVIYAGLKAAQSNIVKNLAKQVAGTGVTINNLAPGAVDTPRNADVLATPEDRAAMEARIPVGFVAVSEDISGAAVFLASDAARYVTGADLIVDGGWAL